MQYVTTGMLPQIHVSLNTGESIGQKWAGGMRNTPVGKMGVWASCRLCSFETVLFFGALTVEALDRSWQHNFEWLGVCPARGRGGDTGNLHSYPGKKGACLWERRLGL